MSNVITIASHRVSEPRRCVRWKSLLTLRIREFVGGLMNRFGVAGAVASCEIEDVHSGHRIAVHNSKLFTRIRINGRDFYFNRITGKFDGTGNG